MSPSHPEASSPSSTLDVPGGRLAYSAHGSGRPIVFVHSVIADQRMWDREVADFGRDHRAVRFGLRGFGGSTPASGPFSYSEDVRALVSHLGLERPFLVGSSMGGAIALNYALDHPRDVSGLLLAAPGLSGGFEPPFDPEELAAFATDETMSTAVVDAWRAGDRAAAVERLRALWCAALSGEPLERWRRMVEENAREVFDSPSERQATAPPAAARLPGLRLPVWVLAGDRDNPSSPVFARRIAAALPDARLEIVTGADHLINLSKPAEFDRALRAAIAAASAHR